MLKAIICTLMACVTYWLVTERTMYLAFNKKKNIFSKNSEDEEGTW